MTQAKPRVRTIKEYLTYDDSTDTHYKLVDRVLVAMEAEQLLNAGK